MRNLQLFFSSLFLAFILISPAFSTTWDGGGSGTFASTAANWSGNVIPTYGDTIIFDGTSSKNCAWDLDETYTSFAIYSGYNGAITLMSMLTLATPNCSAVGHLVISQIRSRGVNGAADEFIELYNPTDNPVVLDTTWSIQARSTSTGSVYAVRWSGSGTTIPIHGHFLIAGTDYIETPAADASLSSSISDASSVRLMQSSTIVDAVCYAYDSGTMNIFQTDVTFTCEGPPVTNPHNNTSSTNVDASIERMIGGAAGNCTDTGDNAIDFAIRTPAIPRNSQSSPAP